MWERVFKENLKGEIPNPTSEEIYAVYSNYESDENGDYDYFIYNYQRECKRLQYIQ
jgi:predicted transcriptional regulator YdeE